MTTSAQDKPRYVGSPVKIEIKNTEEFMSAGTLCGVKKNSSGSLIPTTRSEFTAPGFCLAYMLRRAAAILSARRGNAPDRTLRSAFLPGKWEFPRPQPHRKAERLTYDHAVQGVDANHGRGDSFDTYLIVLFKHFDVVSCKNNTNLALSSRAWAGTPETA